MKPFSQLAIFVLFVWICASCLTGENSRMTQSHQPEKKFHKSSSVKEDIPKTSFLLENSVNVLDQGEGKFLPNSMVQLFFNFETFVDTENGCFAMQSYSLKNGKKTLKVFDLEIGNSFTSKKWKFTAVAVPKESMSPGVVKSAIMINRISK